MNPTRATFLALLVAALAPAPAAAEARPPLPCRIEVVESGSGWPVPLVELRSTHQLRLVSDNAGVIACDAPELMDRETWFEVHGYGYEVPADGFGYRGVRLTPRPGATLRVEVRRPLAAKRIGRLTGGGLFAGDIRCGGPPRPESGALGCDSIQFARHGDTHFWFWGDTTLARYPLGIFHMTGATSPAGRMLPERPPLVPFFELLRDEGGAPRAVAPLEGAGPTWLSGCVSLPDAAGRRRLAAAYVKITPPLSAYEAGLCVWDDDARVFQRHKVVWRQSAAEPDKPALPEGHPLAWRDAQGREWILFGNPLPTLRIPATFEAWENPAQWERLTPPATLAAAGGGTVTPHSGSVAWNAHRRRWVTVFMEKFGKPSAFGEIWFAEADAPTGPWGTAVKVLSHPNYTFYNPRIHPELVPEDATHLLFEGTFTAMFADRPGIVPRHDYNQILYRLDLDDPLLCPRARAPAVNGVWMGKPGNLQEVAIVNNPVPGIPDATFINFPGFLFQANGEGHLALRGFFEGTGITAANDSAVWIGKVGDLALVAREGGPAANLGSSVTFNDLTFNSFSLNSHGQLCLIAGVSTHPLSNNTSLFLGNRNGLTKILQKGEAITGSPGLAWNTFGKPHQNDDGAIVIESTPTPGGKPSFFTRANNGTITRIAEETAAAPGAAGLAWAGFFYSDPSLAGNNFAVFGAGLNPGATFDRDGIWVASGGATRLVAREGDSAIGLAGQTFAAFGSDNTGPAINKHGTVVFHAVTNTGVNGIWRWRGGDLHLLLTRGDFIEVGPGDTREVTSFSVKLGSGGQSGVPSGLNDRGQLVVKVSFKFGSTAIILINDILDQDGDGIDSLLEEAFGGNPDDPADGAGQRIRLQTSGSDMKVVFPRRTDGSFEYVVETSEGMGGWSEHTATPVLSSDQSGLLPETERVEVPIPSGADRLFTRVRVVRVSP
jgi:hypothetical protein